MKPDIKKPNVFIVGAPKCGTTSLFEYLKKHKDIFGCNPKEPNYFCNDIIKNNISHDEDYLTRYFKGSGCYRVIMEGSTHYLCSFFAVKKILEFNPEARFIVMLRNQVDMFESLFYEEKSLLVETSETPEIAWQKSIQGNSETKTTNYVFMCTLAPQIERLFETVKDRNKILFISFNDFTKDTLSVYKRVLNFLELPYDGRVDFPVVNQRKIFNNNFYFKILFFLIKTKILRYFKFIFNMMGFRETGFYNRIINFLRIKSIVFKNSEKMNYGFRRNLELYFLSDAKKVFNLTGIKIYE